MKKHLLVVDDNNKYAELLGSHFSALGYEIDRALTGEQGLSMVVEKGVDYYSVIVTDITMESQLAGVSMLGKIKKLNYPGTIVVASTGFDVFLGVPFSRLFLSGYGVHYLIPKTTVLKQDIDFLPIAFFSPPTKKFEEIHSR